MPGTLTADYLREMRRGNVEPIIQVAILFSSPSSERAYFHNGHAGVDPFIEGDPILIGVTDVSIEMDPVKRAFQVGTIEVEILNDSYVRTLIASHDWHDAQVLISLGTPNLGTVDFAHLFFGRIERVYGKQGSIIIDCTTFDNKLINSRTFASYISKHPLEVLLQAIQDVGVSVGNIDTASFAFDKTAIYSHYCCSSYGFGVYVRGVEGYPTLTDSQYNGDELYTRSMISTTGLMGVTIYDTVISVVPQRFAQEWCELTGSVLVNDTTSKMKMVYVDKDADVTRHLTIDEYSDFEQDPETVIVNRVAINLGGGDNGVVLEVKDSASISKYGDRSYETETVYFCNAGLKGHYPTAVTSSTMTAIAFGTPGFCGTRNIHPDTQVAADKIDAGNPFYCYNRSAIYTTTTAHRDDDATAGTVNFNVGIEGNTLTTQNTGIYYMGITGLSVVSGSHQTQAMDSFVYDCTMAYQAAERILARFSNTAPRIRFRLGLDHLDLELGDTISIDNDWFVSPELDLDGLDLNTKFEITKKEVQGIGADVGIDFEAVHLVTDSPPAVTIAVVGPRDFGEHAISKIPAFSTISNATSADAVVDGLAVTATSDLGYQVGIGRAVCGGEVRQIGAAAAFTAVASKDTYIGIDANMGSYIVHSVANGAAEPRLGLNEIRLGKVVTGGTEVSSVADRRIFGAISVSQMNRELLLPSNNDLWNGDFEDWASSGVYPTAWEETGDGAITVDTAREETIVKTGRYSLLMKATSDSVVWYSGFIPINNLTPYRVSMWTRQGGGDVTMRATLYWYTAAKVAASTAEAGITNGPCDDNNTWEHRSTVVMPGTDVAYAKLKITRPAGASYVCYWDDVSVLPEKPSFLVKRTSSNNTPASDGDNYIFNTEVHDYGGNYDTGTGAFTVPVSGTYEFSATLSLEGADPNRDAYVTMTASTGGVLASGYLGNLLNGTDEWNDNGVFTLSVVAASLVEGETVSIKAYNAAGGGDLPALVYDYSWFSGSLK